MANDTQSVSRPFRAPLFLRRLGYAFVFPFLAYPKPGPTGLKDIPDTVDDEQVDQAKLIFDQAEGHRAALEDKARSIFGTITFLAPIVASTSLFLFKQTSGGTLFRDTALALTALAVIMLLVALLSVWRALEVKELEGVGLDAVLDPDFKFRKYDQVRRAQMYLQCALSNQVVHNRIADLVRGSQTLTLLAVVTFIGAAGLAGWAYVRADSAPAEIRIAGPIEVKSSDLQSVRMSIGTMQTDLNRLSGDIATLARQSASAESVTAVQSEIQEIKSKLQAIQKQLPQKPAVKKKGTNGG
jgi:hypothetical protein